MSKSSSRIHWIDTCKAYGMALVFYGHLWVSEAFPNTEVLLQNKLIYSFHMPLFFILSGFFSKPNPQDFGGFVKIRFFTRIVPFIAFNLLLILFQVPLNIVNHTFSLKVFLGQLTTLIRGQTELNVVTWFLICLFTTELIHFLVSRKVTTQRGRIIAVIVFYVVGSIVTLKLNFVSNLTGISPNFWYIHEAVLAYSFFLMGIVLNQSKLLEVENSSYLKLVYFILSTVVLLATFNLNNGLPKQNFTVVLMVGSMHGHPLYFLVSALAGSLALIFLSQITPENKIILFFGQNTLVLLGLNGLFREIVNPIIVKNIPPEALQGHFNIFLVCLLVTILSFIACVPGILFFNKFLPQLIGKPKEKGPILPNLL